MKEVNSNKTKVDIGEILSYIVLLPVFGTLFGVVFYLLASFIIREILENRDAKPMHVDGQFYFYVGLPYSAVLGFSAGIAASLFPAGLKRISAVLLLGISVCGTLLPVRYWTDNGVFSKQEYVFHLPILGICALVFLVSLGLGVTAYLRHRIKKVEFGFVRSPNSNKT